MGRRQNDSAHPPKVRPLDVDGVRTVAIVTVGWGVAFVALALRQGQLNDAGNGWWLWTCLAGVGLGLMGLEYCRKRRDAIAQAALDAEAEAGEFDDDSAVGDWSRLPPEDDDAFAPEEPSQPEAQPQLEERPAPPSGDHITQPYEHGEPTPGYSTGDLPVVPGRIGSPDHGAAPQPHPEHAEQNTPQPAPASHQPEPQRSDEWPHSQPAPQQPASHPAPAPQQQPSMPAGPVGGGRGTQHSVQQPSNQQSGHQQPGREQTGHQQPGYPQPGQSPQPDYAPAQQAPQPPSSRPKPTPGPLQGPPQGPPQQPQQPARRPLQQPSPQAAPNPPQSPPAQQPQQPAEPESPPPDPYSTGAGWYDSAAGYTPDVDRARRHPRDRRPESAAPSGSAAESSPPSGGQERPARRSLEDSEFFGDDSGAPSPNSTAEFLLADLQGDDESSPPARHDRDAPSDEYRGRRARGSR